MKLIIDSIGTDASRYGSPVVLVCCEDTPAGPAHVEGRIVITGDLAQLGEGIELVPGTKISIEVTNDPV